VKAHVHRALKFMSEVHHSEDIPVMQELFGNCLVPDNSIQKAFLDVGDGENGKSTELNLLKAFVGKSNCSNVSWQQLELNRFAMSNLENKLVNIFADLPSQSLNYTTAFKMLTGNDSRGTEKKFKDQFSFVNYAKLIFSANKLPKVTDEDSYAFWRRWIILEFPNQFTDDKKDPDILTKITTEEELSSLLNWALEGLARIRQQRRYSYNKTVEETTEFYQKAADPVYAFLKDRCEQSSDDWIEKDELYEIFKQYCLENNIPVLKPNSFGRSLQNQTDVRVKSYRPTYEGKRLHAWQGIKIVEDVENER
jgi:putative DNA primase/helicase